MYRHVSPNNTEYFVFDFPRVVKYSNFIGQNSFLLQIEQSYSIDVTSLDRQGDYLQKRASISISDPYKEIYDLL